MHNVEQEASQWKAEAAIFAAAFVHACDDEGTYFGFGKKFYEWAKRVSTENVADRDTK